MLVTKKLLVEMLLKYINRTISLAELVDWAEEMVREADFEEGYFRANRGYPRKNRACRC